MPANPSLREFLLGRVWEERFDGFVLEDGGKLARKRRVMDLTWSALEDGGGLLAARVQDLEGEWHEAEISLWQESEGRWELDASCCCPYAHFCQHAAAVLLSASKKGVLERLLKGGSANLRVAPLRTEENEKVSGTPGALSPLQAKPRFRLEVLVEPANSRPVQLLLQSLRASNRDEWLVARPTASYGDHELPLHTSGDSAVVVETEKGPLEIIRDLHAEKSAAQELAQLGLTHLGAQPSYRFLLGLERQRDREMSAESAWFPEPSLNTPDLYWPWFRAEAVPRLEARDWEVSIDSEVGFPVFSTDPAQWESSLSEQPGGWFALSVGFDLEGERLDLLPILAKLLEDRTLDMLDELSGRSHHLVYLPDGGALQIPVERLKRILRQLASLVDPNRPFLHPVDAAHLASDSELSLVPDGNLDRVVKQLGKLQRPLKEAPPAGVQATLRDYQLEGFHWMQTLSRCQLHGILADDMGLGKTLQTLTHILTEKDSGRAEGRPALVVAPTSVVPNWKAEAAKFVPSLSVLVLQGPKRSRDFRNIPHADLVITSYALLQRDIGSLRESEFHLVVLDEAQNIKNPAAKVTKAACELVAAQRICLSGTPIENHLGELWSLMRFLLPGFLGSQEAFRARFQAPIEKDGDEDRKEDLKARVAPLILRRTKDEVASELPPKTLLVHPVELTTGQKDLYETVRATMDRRVRQAIAAQGLEQSRIVFLDALLKLRQICCDPRLLAMEEAQELSSAKLDYLGDLLGTLLEEKRRVLLFSQFTTMLELIGKKLVSLGIPYLELTGSSRNRGELVDRFQEGSTPLFLISLKAGGTGLNLTAADTVIHYDPWWNPAAEAQATDRAYRIGQTKPVFVHKLICTGTVEERIQKLQADKSKLADDLLAGTNKVTTPDEDTLRQLLAPL